MAKEYALVYPRPDSTFEVVRGRPFHSILKEAREREGIGIRELARKLKCSHVFLIKVERGERTPSPRRLNELQTALGIEPFFLVPAEEFDGMHGVNVHQDGDLKGAEHGASFLYGLLLAALRQGGFDPTLGIPADKDREMGVSTCISLGATRNYEILIREII